MFIAGPAGHSSLPNAKTLPFCIVDSEISFNMSSPSLDDFVAQSFEICFARSMIAFLFTALTSSIDNSLNCDPQGPTLSICSTAAAINDTVDISVLIGIVTDPLALPFCDSIVISILPTFQFFWSSFRFISGPNRPSVWPNIAPIISALSTAPSISKLSFAKYFTIVSGN